MKKIDDLYTRFKYPFSVLNEYWQIYGGWKKFFVSPYVYVSIFLSALIFFKRPAEVHFANFVFDKALAVCPSLLGFTLAGLTVFLGVGDEGFRNKIRCDANGKKSPFIVIVASFMHFTLMQFFALTISIVGKFLFINNSLYGLLSLWVFIYATLTILAAILAIFQLATWYNNSPKSGKS
jgi:hypothetical protein